LTSTYGNQVARGHILGLYEQLAGHTVEEIEYFKVGAMLRRLFTVSVSATGEAGPFGMRPGIEAKIRHDIESVRNAYDQLAAATGIRIPKMEALISSLADGDAVGTSGSSTKVLSRLLPW
jgi:hypothetical protein